MEPKFESELALVKTAKESQEIKYLNWTKGPEGYYWTIDSFRGNRCSAVGYDDGGFTRLVQDPFAEVIRVGF